MHTHTHTHTDILSQSLMGQELEKMARMARGDLPDIDAIKSMSLEQLEAEAELNELAPKLKTTMPQQRLRPRPRIKPFSFLPDPDEIKSTTLEQLEASASEPKRKITLPKGFKKAKKTWVGFKRKPLGKTVEIIERFGPRRFF